MEPISGFFYRYCVQARQACSAFNLFAEPGGLIDKRSMGLSGVDGFCSS